MAGDTCALLLLPARILSSELRARGSVDRVLTRALATPERLRPAKSGAGRDRNGCCEADVHGPRHRTGHRLKRPNTKALK